MALRPNAGHGLPILEVSRSHKDASQSVGLLWTSDQLVARDLYLTTHNTHNKQTSMPPVGLELTISTDERQQTYALDRVATGTDLCYNILPIWSLTQSKKSAQSFLQCERLHSMVKRGHRFCRNCSGFTKCFQIGDTCQCQCRV